MKETTVTCPLNRATTLHYVATTRFKTARLTFLTVRPADRAESPLSTLLYGVMRRGSEHYPRLSFLNRRLDELYGTTFTIHNYLCGDNHVISFTAEMLEDDYLLPADREMDILDGVMAMLSDMLLRPLCDADGILRRTAVEAEKQSLCDSLRALQNDPRTYAADRFRRLMCEGEPYGLSIGGTVEDVTAVTPEELTAYRERHLSSASCDVFYVGRAPLSRVSSLWQTYFGSWDPAPAPRLVTHPHPVPPVPRSVEETLAVSQGKLCLGFSCGDNSATLRDPIALAALSVCNEVFGVMQSSLLFRHVRERLGLCYYCESALDMQKGILWVSSGIRSDRREAAETAIREQFAALQAGKVSSEDIELAKLSLINSYRQVGDSQASIESYLVRRTLTAAADATATHASPEEQIKAIRAVTVEDVVAAAGRFSPDMTYFLRGAVQEGEEEFDDED